MYMHIYIYYIILYYIVLCVLIILHYTKFATGSKSERVCRRAHFHSGVSWRLFWLCSSGVGFGPITFSSTSSQNLTELTCPSWSHMMPTLTGIQIGNDITLRHIHRTIHTFGRYSRGYHSTWCYTCYTDDPVVDIALSYMISRVWTLR